MSKNYNAQKQYRKCKYYRFSYYHLLLLSLYRLAMHLILSTCDYTSAHKYKVCRTKNNFTPLLQREQKWCDEYERFDECRLNLLLATRHSQLDRDASKKFKLSIRADARNRRWQCSIRRDKTDCLCANLERLRDTSRSHALMNTLRQSPVAEFDTYFIWLNTGFICDNEKEYAKRGTTLTRVRHFRKCFTYWSTHDRSRDVIVIDAIM